MQVQVKMKEQEEVSDRWKEVFGNELEDLEATWVEQEADQKQ